MNIWKKINKVNEEYSKLDGIVKFMFFLAILGIGLILSFIIGDSNIVGMAFILIGILLIVAQIKQKKKSK